MQRPTAGFLAASILLLAAQSSEAHGETLKFWSEVSAKEWSKEIHGVLAFPVGAGPFPTVIFLHSCPGWTKSGRAGAEAHAQFLRKNGFATLILDSFGPRGISAARACGGDLSRIGSWMMADDAVNAMAELRKTNRVRQDAIFLAGQSLGGNAALVVAQDSRLPPEQTFRAIAAYYPHCIHYISAVSTLRAPLIIFSGDKDNWTPAQNCSDVLKNGKWDTGPEFQVEVYANALHGFDQPRSGVYRFKSYTMGYDARATADSQKKLLEFFKRQMPAN